MQTRQLIHLSIFTLFLTASIFAVDADAADLKSVVEQQLEIQKQLRDSVMTSQNTCTPDQPPPDSMKQCIQALCPISADQPNYEMTQAQILAEAAKRVGSDSAEIGGTLTAWATAQAVNIGTDLVAFQKLIDSGNLKTDAVYQPLHNVMFLAAELANVVFSENSTIDHLIVDSEKTKEKLKDIPADDQKWMLRALEGFYNLPVMRESFKIGSSSASAILKRMDPTLSLKDALKKEADAVDAASAAVVKKATELGMPPSVLSLSVTKSMTDAARNGQLQDEASLESFLQQATVSLAFSSMITKPENYPWLGGRSTDAITQLMKSGTLADRAKALQMYFAGSGFGKLLPTILQNCISNYSQGAAALPNDAELKAAKLQADGVIADLNSRVFSKLSTHTSAMLAGVFGKAEVFFPRTFAAYKSDFISGLEDDTNQYNASTQFTTSHPGASGAQAALFGVYALIGSDWTPDNYVGQQLNACDDYKLGSLDDRANQEEAVFWASWISVKNPKLGKSVMAHEMGHIMDKAMTSGNASVESAGKYKALEDCLGSKHLEPAAAAKTAIIQAFDKSLLVTYRQYNVEDYADQIAAIAEPDTNLGCCLVSSSDRDDPSVINSDATDTHSSDLFRALFSEQIRKGDIPNVCKAALAEAGTTRNFRSCWSADILLDPLRPSKSPMEPLQPSKSPM